MNGLCRKTGITDPCQLPEGHEPPCVYTPRERDARDIDRTVAALFAALDQVRDLLVSDPHPETMGLFVLGWAHGLATRVGCRLETVHVPKTDEKG